MELTELSSYMAGLLTILLIEVHRRCENPFVAAPCPVHSPLACAGDCALGQLMGKITRAAQPKRQARPGGASKPRSIHAHDELSS